MPPAAAVNTSQHESELWVPEAGLVVPEARGRGGAPASESVGYDEHKPRTPPPDLPSLLLDSRITYLGMPVRALNQHALTTLLAGSVLQPHAHLFRGALSMHPRRCHTQALGSQDDM